MQRFSNRFVSIAGAVLLASGLVSGLVHAQEFGDTIVLADGTRDSKVSIVSESQDSVVYKLAGGTEKTVAVPDVVDIEYANGPQEFRGGYEQWRRGNYEGAIERLASCLDGGTMGPSGGANLLGVYARYYTADSRLNLGGAENCRSAATSFRQIVADDSGSRFSFAARLGLGESLLGMKDAAGAKKAFEDLLGDSRLDGLPEAARSSYRAQATLGLADVTALEKGPKDALGTCQNALSIAGSATPDVDALVRIRMAELQVLAGDAAGVKSAYESMAAEASGDREMQEGERRLAAVALVGLALARVGEKDYVRARENLARVSVQFHTFTTSHAAALFVAGSLHRQLQLQFEKDAAGISDPDSKSRKEEQAKAAADLSARYFGMLRDIHPRSRWARRSRGGD